LVTKKVLEAALTSLKSDLGREFAGMESRLTDKLAAAAAMVRRPVILGGGACDRGNEADLMGGALLVQRVGMVALAVVAFEIASQQGVFHLTTVIAQA